MPLANQETSEDTTDTAINLPRFVLALKQIASSSIPSETIKNLLASIHIKEGECEDTTSRNYQDIIHTLKILTDDARKTGQDFKAIKLLLAQISTEKSSDDANISEKRETGVRNEHKRAADSCTDEGLSTSKKYRSIERVENKASTDETVDGEGKEMKRHGSSRGKNNDTTGEDGPGISAISNERAHAVDNQTTETGAACHKIRRTSCQDVPSTRKGIAGYCMRESTNNSNNTEITEASTSYEVDNYQNVSSTSKKVRNYVQPPAYDCDLCDMSFSGRFNLDTHYRRKHDLTDPDQILFFNGKPLFTTSNMFTDGGKAQWFTDEKEKAIQRYKKKPWICRLCDKELDDPELGDLLEAHYKVEHKVDKMCNVKQLFKQAKPAAHLANLPASNPRKLQKSRKSKSTDNSQTNAHIRESKQHTQEMRRLEYIGDNDIICLSDGEDDNSNNDNTNTLPVIQSIKTENDDETEENGAPEVNINIKQIKSEKLV